MAATYLQLKQRCAVLTQNVSYDTSDTATYDAVFLAKAGVWLNLSQKFLSQIWDFWTELQKQPPYSFNTADGTEAYSMPEDFDKALRVYDVTNKRELTPITEEEYVDGNISNIIDEETGKPSQYRIYGVVNRLKQMKLGLIPDDTYAIWVWYKMLVTDMDEDSDYPFIDADNYFIWDAVGFAHKWAREEDKAQMAWGKAKEALDALLMNQARNLGTNYIHKLDNVWLANHRV